MNNLDHLIDEAVQESLLDNDCDTISHITSEAAKSFAQSIPDSLPAPEILPDDDGYIEFEWYKNRQSFSFYAGEDIFLIVAGFHCCRFKGRFTFNGAFPKEWIPWIEKVGD